MGSNRTTQFIAIVLLLVSVVGAGMLTTPINEQRKELQLEPGQEIGDVPPDVALVTASLGAFRGLIVDILWYRANELKEEGKYYEANTLAQWITRLQPRFPQVWAFHAWNMAYNISVATHTQEERWDWVNKGVRLLRDDGIPMNPYAIRLYRELSWIFFHKIGQYSDDVHWYYKKQLAYEMQQVLGDIDRGGTTEEVIERFRKIGEAPDTVEALIEASPEVVATIEAVRSAGYELDGDLLRQIGLIIMYRNSLDAAILGWRNTKELPPDVDGELVGALFNDAPYKGLPSLIQYLRKQVLKDEYHMQPEVMLTMMEEFGPIDWRHSAAHGAYWAYVGTRMLDEVRDAGEKDIDRINTYRQNIHSLQTLTREGRIIFDPISRHIDQMPDPRFISAYEIAWEAAMKDYEEQTGRESDSYASGHENFLLQAVQYSYLYGDEAQAREYYKKVRDLYGTKPHNVRSGRYLKPLESLVLSEFTENIEMKDRSRQFIDAMIRRGIQQGLANGDGRIYTRFTGMAKQIYDKFQSRGVATAIAEQDRMKLAPWDETLDGTYKSYMLQSSIPLLVRCRVWANSPDELRRRNYLDLREVLHEQLTQAGFNAQIAFRAPRGMEDAELPMPEQATDEEKEKSPTDTIERQ